MIERLGDGFFIVFSDGKRTDVFRSQSLMGTLLRIAEERGVKPDEINAIMDEAEELAIPLHDASDKKKTEIVLLSEEMEKKGDDTPGWILDGETKRMFAVLSSERVTDSVSSTDEVIRMLEERVEKKIITEEERIMFLLGLKAMLSEVEKEMKKNRE